MLKITLPISKKKSISLQKWSNSSANRVHGEVYHFDGLHYLIFADLKVNGSIIQIAIF